jgi:Xaa-Pro aminopeptidase
LDKLKTLNVQAMVIYSRENCRYLSGFTGSNSLLFIHDKGRVLFTDFRYKEAAVKESPDFEVVVIDQFVNIWHSVAAEAKKLNIDTVAFESNRVTVEWFEQAKKDFPYTLVSSQCVVEEMRSFKDETEIEFLSQACKYSVVVLEQVLSLVKPGVTEIDLSSEIQYKFAQKGYPVSFMPIVASGANSSMPHHQPSVRKIELGDFITFDLGCKYNGYCADFTRTVSVGNPTDEMRLVYNIVLDAQLRAIEKIKPDVPCKDIDAQARNYIDEKGYGDFFGHGLGHSVGLEVHENPVFNKYCDTILRPGICISVEPGIYLPGYFGVRIEDLVCVTQDSCCNFIPMTKELIVL